MLPRFERRVCKWCVQRYRSKQVKAYGFTVNLVNLMVFDRSASATHDGKPNVEKTESKGSGLVSQSTSSNESKEPPCCEICLSNSNAYWRRRRALYPFDRPQYCDLHVPKCGPCQARADRWEASRYREDLPARQCCLKYWR
jgi:hypothetical protein